ncbi:MAG: hypothetical protein ACRC79_00620, partial [Acinetobacter junii]
EIAPIMATKLHRILEESDVFACVISIQNLSNISLLVIWISIPIFSLENIFVSLSFIKIDLSNTLA